MRAKPILLPEASLLMGGEQRYPIVREVRFKILGEERPQKTGAGKTIDISNRVIRFATEQSPAPGDLVEMSISWPAQLDSRVSLKLVAKGNVIRSKGKNVAVEIQKYEFRTLASSSTRQ